MRGPLRLGILVGVLALVGCGSTPPPYEPGVRVELARTESGYQPPVFRWDAPIAARVTVRRGTTVMWEVADGDTATESGLRRGPITPPLVYGAAFEAPPGAAPRVLVPARALHPGGLYTVTVLGYDGTVFEGRFSVQTTFPF